MEKKMIAFLFAATAASSFWIRRKKAPPPVSTLSLEQMERMEQMEQMEMVSSPKRRSSNINIPCRSVRLAKYNQDNHSSYSNISVSTSCYLACDPRAWILDIYKKNKILPSPCDSESFVEVSQITQSSSISPLASVKPDSEETCDEYMFPIEDLGRKSSEDCDSHTESMGTVSACKIEPNFDVGECEDMTDTMSTPKDSVGVTLSLLKDDAFCNAPDSLKRADGQHQDNHKREPKEQTLDLRLYYQDPQGQTQGPFSVVDILCWYDQGYFGSELPVCLLDAPEGTEFQSLGELMSNLSLRSQGNVINPVLGGDASLFRHGNHDNVFNPILGGDASVVRHNQDRFSVHDDFVVQDAWSSNGRGNASSNILHDAFDGSLSHFELDINNLTIEDHFLSQNFQKQHLKQQHLMPSHQNQQLDASYLEHLHGPSYQQLSMIRKEHMLKLQVERQQRLQQLEQEEQLHQQHQLHHRMQLLQQQHIQHQQQQHQQRQQQHLMPSHQNQQLNASYLEHLHGPSHQQRSMIHRVHMLKLQVERQQRLQQLEQEEQQHQLHRRMQLLQQQHRQQQHQQRQQHQLHQQRQHPLLGENSVDQILYRQQLLHEPSLDQLIQAKLGHNFQHQNELLEALNHPSNRHMLTLEEQYLLDLQQEQIQSRRFPIASRQQPVMDEERHVGGAWYECGQFISAPVGHHTRSGRPSQLDFVQPLQRNSSFEQPVHVDRNFLLHDRIQKGNFGLNSQSFERSAGTPMPDMDIMNTVARLQGMDLQERYGRTNSPGQMGQLSGNRPQQNWMSNQIHAPHLDAMERNWSEASGQLQNNLTDSQFAGGGTNLYNYNTGPDCAYVDPMANDRMSGIFVRNSDGSLVRRPHPLSSQGVSSELVKGLNSDSFAYSDEMRHEGGGHSASSWTSSCSDTTSSCSDTDAASEASCSDTTSSCSDTDAATEAHSRTC